MPSSTLRADTRVRAIPWRDLLPLTWAEKVWELLLPLPWLAGSLGCYHYGHWGWGAVCSFYLFLTGLRQSHGAQHYTLGIPRLPQDLVMYALSLVMLGSMHAVQVSHLHHHRHCLDEDDAEGSTAGLAWWQAILVGPLFLLRLHRTAWRLGSPVKRRWIAAEVAGLLAVATFAVAAPGLQALRWHVAAMLTGESLTGFFAVWTVHHGCEPDGLFARTQRGRWVNRFCYSMFYHAEHHLFPAVPTCHLPILAGRLDSAMSGAGWKQVVGGPLNGSKATAHARTAADQRSAGDNASGVGPSEGLLSSAPSPGSGGPLLLPLLPLLGGPRPPVL
jgi:fatty acid desaturase